MKTFITPIGLFAIEDDGSQDHLIGDGWERITEEEAEAIRSPAPTSDQLARGKSLDAKALLDASDLTLLRCVENAVAVPQAWKSYRTTLRSIVTTGQGSLPARPAYPPGT